MGAVRLVLALSVVVFHVCMLKSAWWLTWVGGLGVRIWPFPGTSAVEVFFMISGFFMAVVLSTKYARTPVWVFYSTRFLRLYPTYVVVLLASLALLPLLSRGAEKTVFGFAYIFADGHNWTPNEIFLWITTNIAIVGKEVWFFNGAGFAELWAGSDAAVLRGLHPYQIVGPAWSLSLELQFYLLAPFLVRAKTATIVLICFMSVVIRTALLVAGYPFEPYVYYGLPAELCLFLLGILSYRFLWAWGEQKPAAWGWRATIAMCALLIFYPYFSPEQDHHFVDWMKLSVFAAMFFALPLLAKTTTASAKDRFVGDLSYPAYLVHLPLAGAFTVMLPSEWPALVHLVIAVILTIAISALLVIAIDHPVERWRRTFSARRSTRALPA